MEKNSDKIFVNMITRKNYNKNQITTLILTKFRCLYLKKKTKTKSNSYQIKHKQKKFTCTSIEKTWDLY